MLDDGEDLPRNLEQPDSEPIAADELDRAGVRVERDNCATRTLDEPPRLVRRQLHHIKFRDPAHDDFAFFK